MECNVSVKGGVAERELLSMQLLILLLRALSTHIITDSFCVAVLSDRGDEIAIRPKLAAPQFLLAVSACSFCLTWGQRTKMSRAVMLLMVRTILVGL